MNAATPHAPTRPNILTPPSAQVVRLRASGLFFQGRYNLDATAVRLRLRKICSNHQIWVTELRTILRVNFGFVLRAIACGARTKSLGLCLSPERYFVAVNCRIAKGSTRSPHRRSMNVGFCGCYRGNSRYPAGEPKTTRSTRSDISYPLFAVPHNTASHVLE